MKWIPAALLLISVAACSSPLGTEPTGPADAALAITTQAKPVSSLVIEKIGGDCTSGITVRVVGENLSPKSRFGHQWLNMTDFYSISATVTLPKGAKKSVEWTEFWPAETINPPTGGKFNGWAKAVITDAWTGWEHETPNTFIGPAC